MKNDYTIASVTRALKVLKLFDSTHRVMSLTEISALAGLTKSSALRILESLESEDFVQRVEETKKYKLGPALFIIGNTGYEFSSLSEIADPLLKRVANQTELASHMGVLEGDKIFFTSRVYPDSAYDRYAIASAVGAELPCHCTGIGKVLLAFSDFDTQSRLLAGCDYKRYTPNTIVEKKALIAEIDAIRAQGYGTNNEEHEMYVSCITYPVFNYRRQIVAAVSLTGLTQIIKDKDQKLLHGTLKKLANELKRLYV